MSSSKNNIPLKYECVNPIKVNDIITKYKDQPILDYIKDLYSLIEYQRKLITKQEKEIIAIKHVEAWKHYDRPIEEYDITNRKYIDKSNFNC